MWNVTQEGYYLLSTGLFILVLLVFLIGVSWGLKTGEAAERIWKATAGGVTSIVSFVTLYNVTTGILLDGGVNSTYSAIVSIGTIVPVLFIFAFVLGVSKTRRS
jgi:hypothetical protein